MGLNLSAFVVLYVVVNVMIVYTANKHGSIQKLALLSINALPKEAFAIFMAISAGISLCGYPLIGALVALPAAPIMLDFLNTALNGKFELLNIFTETVDEDKSKVDATNDAEKSDSEDVAKPDSTNDKS